ncbi:MAG: MEDS domain-containing protein [Candidatus Magnetominusculus sp. LBB02]|nr:MEDS domain-containing protein [Candidatus Magnetominusculus sp. LBB02]
MLNCIIMMRAVKHEIDFGFTKEIFHTGIHMCHVYNDDSERDMVLQMYVKSGLSANEKVIVLADVDTPEEMDGYLRSLGLTVEKEMSTGQFVIDYFVDVYCRDGRFDVTGMIEKWKEFCVEAEGAGATAVRAAGEALCRQMQIPGTEQWNDYETKLDGLVANYPMSGILCQYDAAMYCGKTIMDIISYHPFMVVRGQIVKNPYYIAP